MGKLIKTLAALNILTVILIVLFFINTKTSENIAPITQLQPTTSNEPSKNIAPITQLQPTTSNDNLKLCRVCDGQSNDSTLSGNYLVIGAISYPGYIISRVLKANKCNYRITEDISSLGFDLGTWNNYDELVKIGITPSILDYSLQNVVKSQLEWLGNDGTLIYIPSLLFNTNTAPFDVEYTSSIMENFINILKRLSTTKVKIVSFTQDGRAVHIAAIKQFSMLLLSFAHFHNIHTTSITLHTTTSTNDKRAVIDCGSEHEVSRAVSLAISQCNECMLKCSYTSELNHHQQRDVVTSTYFSSHSSFKRNNFQFMKGFYMSALKQKLDILLFHDELSNDFMGKLRHYYNNIEFVKTSNMRGRSKNDFRFYILYEYLLDHPEIRSIVLQDIRDGMFPGNPFQVMDVIGDLIYVGVDKSFYVSAYDHFWMKKSKFPECHPSELKHDQIKYYPFFNAGTLGGTRDVMLTFLTRLIKYFDKTPHARNCNMATVCMVAHNHYFDHSYSGYPFEGYTESRLGIPRGLAIRHKDTQYI